MEVITDTLKVAKNCGEKAVTFHQIQNVSIIKKKKKKIPSDDLSLESHSCYFFPADFQRKKGPKRLAPPEISTHLLTFAHLSNPCEI